MDIIKPLEFESYTPKKRTEYLLEKAIWKGNTIDAPPFSVMKVEAASVSDGHHTMDELYEHRNFLFCAFLNQLAVSEQGYVWRSKLHEDGTMYPGWFIAGAAQGGARKTTVYSKLLGNNNDELAIYINPKSEISYHLPLELWPLLDFVWTLEKGIPFEGYSPKDVLERMRNYYI